MLDMLFCCSSPLRSTMKSIDPQLGIIQDIVFILTNCYSNQLDKTAYLAGLNNDSLKINTGVKQAYALPIVRTRIGLCHALQDNHCLSRQMHSLRRGEFDSEKGICIISFSLSCERKIPRSHICDILYTSFNRCIVHVQVRHYPANRVPISLIRCDV